MSNNHLHLLDRIRNLSVSIIENMSSDAMAMMTDGFNESLVRNVLYVGKTNDEQRKIIKCIKDNYKCWKKETEMFWGTLPQLEVYPDFILELQMDIECGMVVTVEGSVSEPQTEPFVMPPVLGESLRRLKGLSETVADNNTPNLRAIIKEKGKRIEELEAEVEGLKQKMAQTAGEDNQGWIDWLDWDVFHPSIKAEEVYKTIDKKATPELGEKAKCYAFYRVLKEIKWLKKGAAQKDVLKWWSAHFGCEWYSDNQLKFTNLPDAITQATTTDQWKYCGGNNNEYYYNYAQDLKKAFAWSIGQGQYETKPQFVKDGCLPPEKCK